MVIKAMTQQVYDCIQENKFKDKASLKSFNLYLTVLLHSELWLG